MTEFVTPPFLENSSVEEIFESMVEIIPSDIDVSQGSHTWNFLRPTALVGAYLCQYVLPQVIQLIFPEWSYGEFLDAHAKTRGMARKAATAAAGYITISGTQGTEIPVGSIFSTASLNNDDPSITYETTEAATIPVLGSVSVHIKCTEAGAVGNTGANTVVFMGSRIVGVTGATNPDPITGGTDEEDDASLIARIMEYDATQGESYVGNVADYRRWAMSVPGVGNVTIIPANDDTGLVTIIVIDSNGDPATEDLCTAVYNYIMSPDDPLQRLAPINAYLSVEAPTLMEIGIKATVELTEGASIDGVKDAFLEQLINYLPEATTEEEIKITRIGACLSATEGVNDYADLEIGVVSGGSIEYGDSNIAVLNTQLPTVSLEDLALTAGEVTPAAAGEVTSE